MLSGYPIQDIVFVVSVVIVWAFGVQSGLHR